MLFLLSLPLLLVPWLLCWIWRDPRAAGRRAHLLSEGFIPGVGLPRGDLRESSAGLAEDGSGAGPPAPRAASPAGQRRGCSTSILPQCVSPRAGDGPGADAPRAGDSPRADVSRVAGRVHAARFLSISSRVTPVGPSVGSAPAGSSPQPGDSRRVTRARGGGEPEEDGVPSHQSVTDRWLLPSPALPPPQSREAQGSANDPAPSPSRTLGHHGYMGTEEGRSEAASRPLVVHDVDHGDCDVARADLT